MTKKIFLSWMAVLGLLLSAHAQEREITGSVKDHAGAGIVGATIVVEGTTRGTTSGADGVFSIEAAPDNVLVVSFMGYQSHTIRVGSQTRIDVVLKEDTQAIDDVIVVAFGTAKKEAFTGSAAVIKSDDITKSQQSNERSPAYRSPTPRDSRERAPRFASAASARSTPATTRCGSWTVCPIRAT